MAIHVFAKAVVTAFCLFLSITSLQASSEQSWSVYKKETLDVLFKLQGWCPRDKAGRMMELIKKTSPNLCVEIGVFGGSSFLPTTAALKFQNKGLAYGIDPWAAEPCLEGNQGAFNVWWSKIDLEQIMFEFMRAMHDKNLDSRYCLMRMTSKDSLSFFEDESIDILHVDGNHSEESALFDVKNWLPKMRSGGYIWFDDANWESTTKAVQYLLANCDLDSSSDLSDPYLLFRKR
jgi:hypothetical protein